MSNIVPEHSDMTVVFSNVTQNGAVLDFDTINSWHFAMGKQLNGDPLIVKNSLADAIDFTIDPTGKSVSVFVSASSYNEITVGLASGGEGKYIVTLYAQPSGSVSPTGYITHKQKVLNIQRQLRRVPV